MRRTNMKRINNEQLAEIGSMKELLAAQYKVNRAIRRLERNFEGEYRNAKEEFSWANTIAFALSVIDSVQSVGRYLWEGLYSGISAMRSRRRAKKRSKGC